MDILSIAPVGATVFVLDPKVCDPDGSISRYSWFSNSNVGEVLSDRASRRLTVSGLKPGSYEFTLYAYDNKGSQTIAYTQIFVPLDSTPGEIQEGVDPAEGYALEQNEIIHSPAKLPPRGHPRYLGTNSDLADYHAPLDRMGCGMSGKLPGLGDVFSIKAYWEYLTKGVNTCGGATATSDLSKHPLLKCHSSVSCTWSDSQYAETLYLLRRLEQCHSSGGSGCQYTADQVKTLRKNIYSNGIAYFKASLDSRACEASDTVANCTKAKKWNLGYGIYDLFTEVPVRLWALFADIYWDELHNPQVNANATADFEMIKHQFDIVIDGWLNQQKSLHWVYANGNNWSPIQARGLIAWAIVFYYEDSRVKDVLKSILDTLWLHRDYYLAEGYYLEGQSYNTLSFDPLRDINRAIYSAFGRNLRSVKWEYVKKLSRFFLDFIGSDGLTVDFGDSWIKRGWTTMNPIYAQLVDEILHKATLGSTSLSACEMKEFFSNKYYDYGVGGGWSIDPAIARDFETLVSQCSEAQVAPGSMRVGFLPEGGNASFRVFMPNSTVMGSSAPGLRFKQADQTYLAIEASNSAFPHRELDFGQFIWSAYGVRYLSDWGYGKIVDKSDPYNLTKNVDFLPSGHNTLYVPEQLAVDSSGARIANTDMSQIWKVPGTMQKESIGGFTVFHLDGSAPYGANDTAGLVKYFDRWFISIGNGNFVMIDYVKMKSGVTSRFQESFYSHHRGPNDPASGCDYNSDPSRMHINVSRLSTSVMELAPVCSPLGTSSTSSYGPESIARIYGASREDGAFELAAGPQSWINYSNVEERRSRYRWVPSSALNEDLRLFVLVSATSAARLPSVAITRAASGCSAQAAYCFSVNLAGQIRYLGFGLSGDHYILSEVR